MTGCGMSFIEKHQQFLLWSLLAVSIISISSAGAVFQLMDEVKPMLRASWRFQATALFMLPIFIVQFNQVRKDPIMMERLKLPKTLWIIVGSGLSLGLHMGAWVWSLDNTSLAHSLLFVTTHPLIIVLGLVLMRRYVHKFQIRGALIGFLGGCVALMGISTDGDATLIGDLAAFVGAIAVVGYFIAGRNLRQWMPLFVYIFPVTLIAAIELALVSLISEGTSISMLSINQSIFGWISLAWAPYVLYLAIFPGIVGHAGISSVLRWFSPIIISVAYLFEPLIGSFIGWMFGTMEIPSIWTWVGGLILISGTAMVIAGERELEREMA